MIPVVWIGIQLLFFAIVLWLGWRYFDKRYKGRKQGHEGMYDASLERTSEVFIDPKDGHRYRVYYNRRTGEREYVQED